MIGDGHTVVIREIISQYRFGHDQRSLSQLTLTPESTEDFSAVEKHGYWVQVEDELNN